MKGKAIALLSVVFISAGFLVVKRIPESFRRQIFVWSHDLLVKALDLQEATKEAEENSSPVFNAEATTAQFRAKPVPELDAVIDAKRYRTGDSVVCCEGTINHVIWIWLMKASRTGALFVAMAPLNPMTQELVDPNIGNISLVESDDAIAFYYKSTVRHRPFEEVFPDVAVSEA